MQLFDEAIKDYTSILDIDSNYMRALIFRGLVYEKQNKIDLSQKDFHLLNENGIYIDDIRYLFLLDEPKKD